MGRTFLSASEWNLADRAMSAPRACLDDAVERAAGGGEGVDAARHFGVFDERRGVVRFEAGVDHERAAAAPVFVFGEGVDAVDVGGRVRARERDPEEVAERLGDELGVVDDDDQAEAGRVDRAANVRNCGVADSIAMCAYCAGLRCEDAGQNDARIAEAVGQVADRLGSSVASSNRGGPTAAMTTFEPALSALPE